jgi:hypothetical protein
MTDPETQDRLAESEHKTTPLPPPQGRPALTIHIHSWATPIVGLVMLILGLVGGFYAYPLIEDRLGARSVTAAGAPTAIVAAQPTDAAPSAESQASLMEFVVSQTNHFIGDPNAPVTLIEFSDFQ